MGGKKIDLGGVLLSLGYLLHCVLLPSLLTTGLTIWGVDVLENLYVELLLVISAGIIGGLSFLIESDDISRGMLCLAKQNVI